MSNFNQVILMGRLADDPEKQEVGDGISLVKFPLAVNRIGKEKDVADFFRVTCWRQTADLVAAYKSKGDPVQIIGHLQQDRWQDNEGNNRTAITVVADRVVFIPRGDGSGNQKQPVAAGAANTNTATDNADDIPF